MSRNRNMRWERRYDDPATDPGWGRRTGGGGPIADAPRADARWGRPTTSRKPGCRCRTDGFVTVCDCGTEQRVIGEGGFASVRVEREEAARDRSDEETRADAQTQVSLRAFGRRGHQAQRWGGKPLPRTDAADESEGGMAARWSGRPTQTTISLRAFGRRDAKPDRWGGKPVDR